MPPVARVAVAKGKRAFGVGGAGAVDWRAYEVLEVRDALTRTYATDAHLVTYVLPGAARQPRINKAGLPIVEPKPVVEVFFCDVDNEHHAPWTPQLMEAALAEEESLPLLATAGVYYTAHGRRIVQPLAEPLPVENAEPYLRRWFRELEAAGLAVDWHCRDWTRHFRLPNVRRGGDDYRSPRIALERMRAIDPAPFAPPLLAVLEPSTGASTPAAAPVPALDWTREIPRSWVPKVERLAAAVRSVDEAWHPLFLDLAGALLASGVPAEHVPVVCRSVSIATGLDSRTDDREAAAKSTVQRKLAGLRVTGLAAMRRRYPAVAQALEDVTARGARARALAYRHEAMDVPPVAESVRALERAIRTASEGVTLLSAECGLGKTQAAIRVAVERAAAGLRTAMSVDKNALARQIAADVHRAGAKVLRLFGPLSVTREDGTPECRFHETARMLTDAGQSVHHALCEGSGSRRCEHWDECRARNGREGDEDALITIGPHALLTQLKQSAGDEGLLVIDEPPSVHESIRLPLCEIRRAIGSLHLLAGHYAAALEPALLAVGSWTALTGQPGAAVGVEEVAGERLSELRSRAATSGVAAGSTLVPIQPGLLFSSRNSAQLASRIAAVSRTCGPIHRALTGRLKVSARLLEGPAAQPDGGRVVVLSGVREELESALTRPGPTVLLDANAEIHTPVLPAVVGRETPIHRFRALDGAPIQRVLLKTRAVNRARWWRAAHEGLDGATRAAILQAFRWAAEGAGATTLGIVTFLPVEMAFRLVFATERVLDAEALRGTGFTRRAVEDLASSLRSSVQAWRGPVCLGHYGAMRGLDSMSDVDCLITFGDPWPNLDAVRHDVEFFGIAVPWQERAEALCRAELEQAHGRLRVVHRQRPGRAMHVGALLPGGSGWETGTVEIRTPAVDRAREPTAMAVDELRRIVDGLGGIRATARRVGCSHPTIAKYLAGRPVPSSVASAIRKAGDGCASGRHSGL